MTPTAGVKCAECDYKTYTPTGAVNDCVWSTDPSVLVSTDPFAPQDPQQLNCSFQDGDCQALDGTCVRSKPGVLCQECHHGRGYVVRKEDLSGYACSCYSHQFDPNKACQLSPFYQDGVHSEQIVVPLQFQRAICQAHHDPRLGCFDAIDPDGHKYGTDHPPVPYRCCSSILGPPPGELRETITPDVPLQECNTYGGPDPNQNDTQFHTCNNHGVYDILGRNCTCDRGWAPTVLGVDYWNTSRLVYGCAQCDTWYGPKVDLNVLSKRSFCRAIYSPEPTTGELLECGGHGKYYPEDDACACNGNRTHGYWRLVQLIEGDKQIRSCSACQGDYVLPDCV